MRPQRWRAASTIAASVASLPTSAAKATHSPRAWRAMATVSSAEARLLSTASTFAPSCANRSTVARPLPMPSPGDCPAPTTMATLSLRRMATSHRGDDVPIGLVARIGRTAIRAPAGIERSRISPALHPGYDCRQIQKESGGKPMIDRRTFSALLAGTVAAPRTVWSQAVTAKTVFYASGGPELNLYDVDIAGAALRKHSAVTLPANVQYAWPHPSKRYFYVVSSSGGPGVAGTTHVASAFRIDPASGALAPHGEPQSLPSRPIHCSVDRGGEYLLTAYNAPSNVTVHRIKGDGTLGDIVSQPEKLDAGIYAHQIRTTPANRTAILVARGNNADGAK